MKIPGVERAAREIAAESGLMECVSDIETAIIKHTGADLALELCESLLRYHRLANPDGPCGCGLCNSARQIQAKLSGI